MITAIGAHSKTLRFSLQSPAQEIKTLTSSTRGPIISHDWKLLVKKEGREARGCCLPIHCG